MTEAGASALVSAATSFASAALGWNHGPKNHRAAGAGWPPSRALKRASAAAGVGPANTRRRSSGASTIAVQIEASSDARWNSERSSLSTRTPYPADDSNHGIGK